ncbi:MAG: hypothetical protein LBH19_13990 [Dysgonamonadaceae bacterium]|jgi:hypothetical protein|nr:hypothetical protein [Dysgonamonadaceae bacterium]
MKQRFILFLTLLATTACVNLPDGSDGEEGDTPSASTLAEVTVGQYIAINNGIYYYFKPSDNTGKYYWTHYPTAEVPAGDNEIINDCKADGVEMTNSPESGNEGYSYNLPEQTSYTICAIAYDSKGKQGKLTKKVISTKSSPGQPLASITINNISSGTLSYNVTQNSYCKSYALIGYYNLANTDLPDIFWAAAAYEQYFSGSDYVITSNRSNYSWTSWQGICLIATLGFNAGKQSGIVDRKYFSATTNSVLSSAPLRSGNGSPEKVKVLPQQKERLHVVYLR